MLTKHPEFPLLFHLFTHFLATSTMEFKKESKIKKPNNHNKNNDPFNIFNQLPYEMAIDILSRLPITSLVRLSFVCRSLNALSRDPNLITMHLSRSPPSNENSLILIFHSDYPIRNQLHFLELSNKKVRKIDTPFTISMPEFSLLGSSNGLLCLINTLFSESIYFYNPFTRDYFELPKNFEPKEKIVVYGFGFHQVINDYKVIKIAYTPRRFQGFDARQSSEVEIYSLRRNVWENKGVVPYRLEKWSSPGVLVSGSLHWVSRGGRHSGRLQRLIVSFDLADDSFHTITNPGRATGSFGRWLSCHLGALHGYLCAVVPVHPGHGALEVWIMKEYGNNQSWVKEYTIGTYYPVSMISDRLDRSSHIWRNMFGRKLVQIFCVLESGELLLEYRGGGLVTYDPCNGSFKELVFDGMPRIYQTMVHVASLVPAASLPL